MASRLLISAAAAAWAGIAAAQLPDVAVFADLRPTLRFESSEAPVLRWIDQEGRASVVGLRFVLENGSRVKLSQRFQKVPGDPDSLDEYWISLNDEWQVGKQYLPFGQKGLIRESVVAARFNTSLIIDGLPAEVAAFDGGKGFPRGVCFRLGRQALGVSAAIGDHIGVQGTSLTPLRNPGQAPGHGRGWKSAFGADGSWARGPLRLSGEIVFLRNGNTSDDRNEAITDLKASYALPVAGIVADAAWARSWGETRDVIRLGALLPMSDKASLRPLVRFDRNGFRDIAVTCWVRL
jgi:hypothetical protein